MSSAVEPRLQYLLGSLSDFSGSAAQHDDVTAMVVGYRGAGMPT